MIRDLVVGVFLVAGIGALIRMCLLMATIPPYPPQRDWEPPAPRPTPVPPRFEPEVEGALRRKAHV